MKEIIEYILSAIILISIIPIYNYVTGNLYSSPQFEVDVNFAYSLAERIAQILDKEAQAGNLSSPFFNPLESLIRELGFIGKKIGLYVEIISNGIKDIKLNGNLLEIETLIQGNLSILIVYRNGGMINLTINKPVENKDSMYIYRVVVNEPDNIVFIASLIDDGLYRYVNYLIRDEALILRIGSINKMLYLFSDKFIGDESSVNLVAYSWNFEIFNDTVTYRNITKIEQTRAERGQPGYIKVWNVYTNTTTLKYMCVRDDNTSSVNLHAYQVLLGSEVVEEKISYVVDVRGPKPRLINYTIEEINESTILGIKPINTPIYNIPVIIVRGTNGTWVAYWYPHNLSFGYGIPREIPVTEITLIKRIGMVDYVLKLYVWRLI